MNLSKKLLEQIDAFGYGQQSSQSGNEDECADCCEKCGKKKQELKENKNPVGQELAAFNKRLSGLKMFRTGRRG